MKQNNRARDEEIYLSEATAEVVHDKQIATSSAVSTHSEDRLNL